MGHTRPHRASPPPGASPPLSSCPALHPVIDEHGHSQPLHLLQRGDHAFTVRSGHLQPSDSRQSLTWHITGLSISYWHLHTERPFSPRAKIPKITATGHLLRTVVPGMDSDPLHTAARYTHPRLPCLHLTQLQHGSAHGPPASILLFISME